MAYLKQYTVQYKTFVKRALVTALGAAFSSHPDPTVANSKVAIDSTDDDFHLPAVIIHFYERKLPNAGVGHFEWFPWPLDADLTAPGNVQWVRYQHRLYQGDIEFEIFGETSVDRDLLADALVETFAMIETSSAGQTFIGHFYNGIQSMPYGLWHFATLNTDDITGYGENTNPPPWSPEDDLIYQTSYRVPIFGEFYSYTPEHPDTEHVIDEVDVYPWVPGMDPPPQDAAPGDYFKFTGEPPGSKSI
jgi:hypothetical protein